MELLNKIRDVYPSAVLVKDIHVYGRHELDAVPYTVFRDINLCSSLKKLNIDYTSNAVIECDCDWTINNNNDTFSDRLSYWHRDTDSALVNAWNNIQTAVAYTLEN